MISTLRWKLMLSLDKAEEKEEEYVWCFQIHNLYHNVTKISIYISMKQA